MAQTTPNTRPSPLARVKSKFGGKKELVSQIKALATGELWANDASDEKALGSISNAKLLHLFDTLTEAKSRFGSRDKLIDAVIAAEGRTKDADYRKHFSGWSVARLFDSLKSSEKSAKKITAKKPAAAKTEAKAAAPAKAEKAAPAKAEAKKAEAPKAEAPKAEKAEKKPAKKAKA